MKLVLINSVCGYGSTGKIVANIASEYENNGWDVKIAYGRAPNKSLDLVKYSVRIGGDLDVRAHGLYTRLTDKHGLASRKATRKFLDWLEEYKPDRLWLHNIHGYYINYEMLFTWIKSHPKLEVLWTLHDCWAFTGHCSHFQYVKCDKWETGCYECVQHLEYPKSYVDNSAKNYISKKNAFTGVTNLKIITPSNWLAGLVRKSFLREYPIEVRHNTINKDVFRPVKSDFRERYNIVDKRIILGVASVWNERKGFNDFIALSTILDEESVIVLVGVSAKQRKHLPRNIIGIERTNSVEELVKIYSAVNVFFNPTYEDTYPTVNLEAEACGCRIVTYDVGGARETIKSLTSMAISPSQYKILAEKTDFRS